MAVVTEIQRCEVCDNRQLVPLLDLGDQAMCDDLVPIGNDSKPTPYPLRLVGCTTCITVHQAAQVEKQLLFPQTYHYRAAMTEDVLRGMADLADSVSAQVGSLEGRSVLDIGCNDGSLLNILKQRGAMTAGVEPTGAAEDARKRVDWVHHGFFDAEAVAAYRAQHRAPDIVTFTNVFAHIEDLNAVLANLNSVMGPDTLLVIENHYLGAVVERAQFDTFYHEHPRTYSYESFVYISKKLGRVIEKVEFPARYNGNIRVMIGKGAAAPAPDIDESGFLDGVRDMQPRIDAARTAIRDKIDALVAKHGPLPGKAFPGRAAILVHAFGLDETMIDATYERSASSKVGYYVPGTHIEIRDEAEFFRDRMRSPVLVNFAWHIQNEIERYMRSQGYAGEIVPVFA